jgi:sigma-54 dependent transcriptional regulator, acetoin dehydrogenase operon transcriptional activator AcoR
MVETLGETLRLNDGREARKTEPGPRPFLYCVLELDRPIEAPSRHALHEIDEVVIGRGPVRSFERSVEAGVRRLTLRIPDRWMSSTHARMGKVLGRWVLGDARSKNGTIVNGARTEHATLADGDLIELGHTLFIFRSAVPSAGVDQPDQAGGALLGDATPPGLSTLVPPLARDLGTLAQISASTVSMIVHGESGTGKELIARAIHQISGRPGAFVAVNCGALPDTLVETELFGYRKGAFSGANEDRPGLVRAADRGTLFLDEIGDLPASSQSAFLRVLQEREVLPVGGTKAVPVDIRLVAATHRDLEKLVESGQFRGDLYARLSGFTITLPPLRERLEDLGLLISALLRRLEPDRAGSLALSLDAARAMFRHAWPLNVRELEKSLTAACVLAREGVIELDHLPESVRTSLTSPRPAGTSEVTSAAALVTPASPLPTDGTPPGELEADPGDDAPLSDEDRRRREQLIALFREHCGNVSAVARAMGKARMQIQRWMRRYKIDPESFRRP